jgi:hypothetical protein
MDFHLNALQDAVTISEHRANSTQARLAEAKTRIMGEIFITIIRSFNLAFKILLISSLNFFRLIGSAGKPPISCGVCGRVCQLQGRYAGGSPA